MKNIKAVLITLILALAPMAHGSQTRELEWQCLTIAKQNWPENYMMQKFEYDHQLEAARYMLTVTDADVKRMAISSWPNNFMMQKFEYDHQVAAKAQMESIATH